MAIITLFWKEHIGLTLTQILLLQSIFSIATVLLDYPAGYVSDRLGYRVALNIASLFGIVGWGIYTVAATFTHVMVAEIMLGISLSFISGSDSALLYETLRAEGKERLYARFEPRIYPFPAVGIFPYLFRMHRHLCGEAGRHRGGTTNLSPSPLLLPYNAAALFTPLSQEHTRAERDMRNRKMTAITFIMTSF